ncbi:MAG: trigger factor [Bacteroidota bacterium]
MCQQQNARSSLNLGLLEVIFNSISAAEGSLTVKLAAEDYKHQVNAEIKKYARKIRIPGFRPGNTAIIWKRYGSTIAKEAVEKILNQTLEDYIKVHQLNLLTQAIWNIPKRANQQLLNKKPIEVSISLELVPDFDVQLDKSITVQAYQVAEVDRLDQEDYLKRMRNLYGTVISVEKVEKDSIIHCRPTLQNKDIVIIRASADGLQLLPDLLGRQVGDSLSLSYDLLTKVLHGIDLQVFESVKDQEEPISLTIDMIENIVPAPLDKKFYEHFLDNPSDRPIEELTTYLTNQVRTELQKKLDTVTKNKIQEALVAKFPITLPNKYTEKEQKDISFMLILEKISQNAGIDVAETDLDEALLRATYYQLSQRLGKSPDNKQLLAYFSLLYPPSEKEKSRKRFRLANLTGKVLPYVKANIEVQTKSISSSEAGKLLAKSSHAAQA